MPKYSYIITEGYERSKVYIDEVLRKKLTSIIESMDLNGVTSVDELPDSGEEGKIYYNTSDGKYYTYSNDDGFVSIVDASNLPSTAIPIVPASQGKHTYVYTTTNNKETTVHAGTDDDFASGATGTPVVGATRDENGYYLEPDKFYELGTVGELRLYCVNNSDTEVKEYMGRFTVSGDAFNLNCLVTAMTPISAAGTGIQIIIPDDTPDFEDSHTYEFNISASVLAVKNITQTNQ